MPPSPSALEQHLGHVFKDRSLLTKALSHRSFGADHNERLEFLGDAVLSLVISSDLYQRFSVLAEGDLSRVRASLVREEALHRLALQIELPAHLRLGAGEARSGGSKRASILADALEALFGAIYLDAGFETAYQVVHRLFVQDLESPALQSLGKDPKTELQEWLQARREALPAYRIAQTTGSAHQQTFVVVCEIQSGRVSAQGQGNSRRAAEQQAAQAVLQQVKSQGTKPR